MKLLYGKPVADKILGRLEGAILASAKKPGLAVILVGSDEASKIYVTLKEKTAKEIGMNFFRFDLDEKTSQQEIIERIKALNGDVLVNGIIVQLPLPDGFDTQEIISSIDPQKDADGFSGKLTPVFPHAIMRLIESSGEMLEGKKGIVIANSNIFGSAMASMLSEKKILADFFLVDDISENLEKIKEADIVVSAVGRPELLSGDMFKSGVIVIDGGIEKIGEKVLGDVDLSSLENLSGFVSPVPGGVGPVTIACLLENVHSAFEAQQKQNNS